MKSAQANTELFTKMQQDHTLALENTATAKQANRTLVAQLTKTIVELSTQVSTLTTKLATSHSYNTCLKNRDIVRPQLSTDIVRPVIRPHHIKICSGTAISIRRAGKIRPQWVLIISRDQCRGFPYFCDFPLTDIWPQQIGDSAGHQGRVDMEQGVDQRRAN